MDWTSVPSVSAPETWLPLRAAWDSALYGPTGFYRASWPGDHFRTSVHASPLFADAVLALARRLGVATIVDVGAGRGEMLTQLLALDGDLELIAVELRPRPERLPPGIAWGEEMPAVVDGLLIANEVVDNVACDVVEIDPDGVPRIVEVQGETGMERLGDQAPAALLDWLARWWPIERPGERAEVGLPRELWWADVRSRVRAGGCLAIDYGHVRAARPALGTLASYREGRSVPVGFTGDRDITADVAVDALQATVGGSLRRQAEWLIELGLEASRPTLEQARADPAGYVRALSRVGEAAELTASGGLGDFWWLLSTADDPQSADVGA